MNKIVRNIREPLKKPRPLRSSSIDQSKDSSVGKAISEVLSELEALNLRISNCDPGEPLSFDISQIWSLLKKHGEELEASHKDALDRYFCTLRNASREDRLDVLSRLKLLEIIELRAMRWEMNENLSNYFMTRYNQLEGSGDGSLAGSISPSLFQDAQNQNLLNAAGNVSLSSGEFLKSSGKFNRPTKIAGKNYFKDEIVIRNSDSGKVMGIKGRRVHMIEELSDTVISFQRVNAGARDRLVQITGPHEEAISHAKFLVEDTIKRNVSPVRDNLAESLDNKDILESYNPTATKRSLSHSYSMNDASFKEMSVPIQIGHDVITIVGKNPDLLKAAKKALMDFFFNPASALEKDSILPLTRSASSSNNERFQLKRQSSLQGKAGGMFVMGEQPFSRRSSSSASWSSDEMLEKDTILDVPIPPPLPPRHVYSRQFLLECSKLPLSQRCPPGFESFLPEIKPQVFTVFDPSPYIQNDYKSL